MNTLSACIINKDSEKYIAGCLQSIHPFVDEIVIVDTGSTDKSIEIARYFNPSIWTFYWNNSFADARNWAMSKCGGTHILIIDTDERLIVKDEDEFRDEVFNGISFHVELINPTTLKNGRTRIDKSHLCRILKNSKGFVYEGSCHESISPSIRKQGYDIPVLRSAKIVHLGYDCPVEGNQARVMRNLLLLCDYAKTHPTDFMTFYHLGKTFAYNEQLNDAAICFEQARNMDGNPRLKLELDVWLSGYKRGEIHSYI